MELQSRPLRTAVRALARLCAGAKHLGAHRLSCPQQTGWGQKHSFAAQIPSPSFSY